LLNKYDNVISILNYLFTVEKPQIIEIEYNTFEDRFNDLELIDKGGFGSVYKAFDKQTNMIVAIKKVSLENRQLNTEVCILKSLQKVCSQYILCYIDYLHDEINKEKYEEVNFESYDSDESYYDYESDSEEDKYGYIITEFLGDNWVNLDLYQKEKINIPTENDIHLIIENLKKGLLLIHEMGVGHRDIKPLNIMIDIKTLNIKYLDFGNSISKSACKNKIEELATMRYVPPEGVAMNYENSLKGDIWSLGLVCLELILSFQKYFPYYEKFTVPKEILDHLKSTPDVYDKVIEAQNFIKYQIIKKDKKLLRKNKSCKMGIVASWKLIDEDLFISPSLHQYFRKTIIPLLCEDPNKRKIILQENLL
jgi:serine/threonine protein kinase